LYLFVDNYLFIRHFNRKMIDIALYMALFWKNYMGMFLSFLCWKMIKKSVIKL